MIGNAVPVRLAYEIAMAIDDALSASLQTDALDMDMRMSI